MTTHEIVLSAPGKNALSTPVFERLLEELSSAAGRPVLIRGEGDAFSAGLNLREIAGLDGEGMPTFLRLFDKTFGALYTYPGPIVCAVNGHAIAGGCVLALCCDYRVATAAEGARIGLNEVPLGLRFPPRTLEIVRRRVPMHHLDYVVLGGGLFDPKEALRLGLVDEVAEDPVAAARARLEALAKSPPEAYAAAKLDLRGTISDLGTDEMVERWLQASADLWTGPGLRARLQRFLRKEA